MPTSAGSGCKYNESAATAGGALLVDGAVEHGIGIMRAARMGHTLRGQRRYNCGIRASREAAEDRETKKMSEKAK